MMGIEQTGLWRRAFESGTTDDGLKDQRRRLEASYRSFWRHATVLAAQIAHDLPNLTLHDEHHFVALWQRADLIAGSTYPLNPLETFVLGGAILLHDAGHAVNAYPGELSGIEATPQWQDSVMSVLRGITGDLPPDHLLANPPPRVRHSALFETLRTLHAERAKTLGELSFTNRTTGEILFLIEDSELRNHLSEVIGSVAASHHWDVDDLEIKLRRYLGAPAFLPSQWTVNPIKLACLLRCADAVQIDQARAPDFSYALLRLKGLSESHWRGQNRLAAPAIDPADPQALLFTSTRAFQPDDVNAWWIAHDAIAIANRELVACSRLLKDLGIEPFAITRVRDAEAPIRLSKHVEVRGWRPIAAEIRVARVEQLVAILGGEHLYGHDLAVPLRELIQNADDAIRARRSMETEESGFSGLVTVKLVPDKCGGGEGFWLHVEDNGIGMSERRVTGPLLEFGTSYWSSDLIKREFPGLAGKRLRQTGQYGIGFFSALMASDRIIVASRSYEEGSAGTRSLRFQGGLKLRPLLLEGADPALPMGLSTRVSLFLLPDRLRQLLGFQPEPGEQWREITLAQLVGHICPSLACTVRVEEPGQGAVTAHLRDWQFGDLQQWLARITLADSEDTILNNYLERAAPFLRPITSSGRQCGFAAIAFRPIRAGIDAIGGLISGHNSRSPMNFSDSYVGVLEIESGGARRQGGGRIADPRDIATWASEQAHLLSEQNMEDAEFYHAAASVAALGGDPTPVARIPMNRKFVPLSEIFRVLQGGGEIFAPFRTEISLGPKCLSSLMLRTSPYSFLSLGVSDIEFICPTLEWLKPPPSMDSSNAYRRVPTDTDAAANSLLDCLKRYCRRQERELIIETGDDVVLGRYTGAPSEREGIETGMEIRGSALKLRLLP